MAKKKTTDAVEILHALYVKGDPQRLAALERKREMAQIAGQVDDRRTQAGISQAELARLAGTTQSVIDRLEDADYSAYSLNLLRRIASALKCRLQVRFVPQRSRK